MKSYYDHRAPWHDEYMNYQGIEKMHKLYASIIKFINPLITDKSVLEIACGTGNWTQVIAQEASEVIAIDASSQSLTIAKDKLRDFENISFKCADAYSLESFQSTIDVVIAVDWFSHIPKQKINSFLTMIQKIVKSQTPVIFIGMSENQYFVNENNIIDSDDNRISKRELPDGSSFEVIKNFQSEEEFKSIFSIFADDFTYRKFTALERWMVLYQTK